MPIHFVSTWDLLLQNSLSLVTGVSDASSIARMWSRSRILAILARCLRYRFVLSTVADQSFDTARAFSQNLTRVRHQQLYPREMKFLSAILIP